MSGWVATACAECDDQSQHFRSLDDLERHIDPDGCRRIDPLLLSGDPVSSSNRLVGHARRAVRSPRCADEEVHTVRQHFRCRDSCGRGVHRRRPPPSVLRAHYFSE